MLWPGLGEQFGEVVNPALVVGEVAALIQVILLAVYRAGTDRFAPRLHAGLLWPVSLAGATSIGCAVALNTWLATAHDAANGNPGPGAMLSPAMWARTGHALAAGVMVAGFAVASVHASGLRRGVHLIRNSMAFRTGMGMGSAAALVQAVAGWLSSVFDAGGSSQWAMVDAMFWLMAALGAAFVALGVLFWWGEWTGRSPAASDTLLVGVSWLGAASVTAMVAGWLTSVLGRSPWLVDGVLLSADAVTRRGGTWLGAALLVGVLIVSTWIGTFVGRMKD